MELLFHLKIRHERGLEHGMGESGWNFSILDSLLKCFRLHHFESLSLNLLFSWAVSLLFTIPFCPSSFLELTQVS